jgi:hypothetical protein
MSEQFELTPASAHARPLAMPHDEQVESPGVDAALHRRTLRKLDWLLLPFLALLFLFNSLDKSNVGLQLPPYTTYFR